MDIKYPSRKLKDFSFGRQSITIEWKPHFPAVCKLPENVVLYLLAIEGTNNSIKSKVYGKNWAAREKKLRKFKIYISYFRKIGYTVSRKYNIELYIGGHYEEKDESQDTK